MSTNWLLEAESRVSVPFSPLPTLGAAFRQAGLMTANAMASVSEAIKVFVGRGVEADTCMTASEPHQPKESSCPRAKPTLRLDRRTRD